MLYFFMVLLWFLFQVMDSSISLPSADLSGVVDLTALHTLLSIGRASSRQMAGTTISATVGVVACVCGFFLILALSPFTISFCQNLVFHLDS